MITCPVCAVPVDIPGQSLLSEILECADCKSELEIIALDPVMLALAPEVEEDWGE
jgi:alpha-aminoadipate carrier protein LysW